MGNQRPQAFYSQNARLYQRFFVNLLQWEKVLGDFFRENLQCHPGMKVLDAGCGTGSITRVMHQIAEQKGCTEITYHAFDLTPEMLDLFREWIQAEGLQNVSLQQADVLDLENQLPADWKNYDTIVSSAMLEYIPKAKRHQALIALKQLLHQDGSLLLFLTRRTWITRWVGGLWWRTNLFNREQIAVSLQQVGFSELQFIKLPSRWDKFMLAVDASGSTSL